MIRAEESHAASPPPGNEKPIQGRSGLLRTPEGRILLTGAVLTFAYGLWLTVEIFAGDTRGQMLVGMTATNVFFGRAAAMAFGYSADLGHALVIPVNMLIESILVCLVYPLFALGWQQVVAVPWLSRTLERISRTAEQHRHTVQRYGVVGLFVFVWLPFWMTGPVVGCVIGVFLGLRPWVNVTTVLAATYLAILGWALFLRELHDQVAAYSAYAPPVLVAVLILALAAGHLLRRGPRSTSRDRDNLR